MQWIRQTGDSTFLEKSTDGYYGVSSGAGRAHGDFSAFHIEALWAKPTELGVASDLDIAKHICEEHRAKNAAPTS